MSKENNIDRLFREGLSDYTETPPTHVWDSINSQLNKERKQKMILLFWKGSAAAAFIGVIILAGLMFHSKPIENNNLTSKVTDYNISMVDSTNTEVRQNITSHNNLNQNNAHSSINDTFTSNIKSEISIINKTENISIAQDVSFQNTKTHSPYTKSQRSDIKRLEFLENKDGITKTETINPSYIFFIQNKNVIDKHFADAIFEEIEPINQIKRENSPLSITSVGGQISPSYTYRNSNQNLANNESGITKINGGVHLNIKANKRLHVETGVLYSQLGQKFSNTSILVNNSMIYGLQNNKTSSSSLNSEYQNSMGNIEIESSNSDILNDAGSNNNIVTNPRISALKSAKKYNTEVQQELEYIEVPFILKYDIINKGIALSLNGGVSTNFLVGNSAYEIENSDKDKIGSMQGISSVSYSASFGLGMRTPINSSLDFNIEPRVKYFINSITKTSGYDYKPYLMGLLIGINYKF